jgi:hypothetical protein
MYRVWMVMATSYLVADYRLKDRARIWPRLELRFYTTTWQICQIGDLAHGTVPNRDLIDKRCQIQYNGFR